MNVYEPFGDMTYNGLQATVRKRIGTSIIGASYTFSKAINNANGDNGDATLWRAYPVSFALDKQISGFDRAQNFQLYWVYGLPFGKGHTMLNHGLASWVVGNWQISGTLSRESGLPFGIGTTSSINAGGQADSANQIQPSADSGRARRQRSVFQRRSLSPIRRPACSGPPAINLLFGPGFFQMNANVSRIFTSTRR